jgi:site-specific recombinase XerD
MKTVEGLQHNSAAKNIKNLYGVIHTAIKNNWLISNPFRDFSCNYVNPARCYLTDDEINSLINKEFKIDRLAKVRDVFVFQIYTGLSFADLYDLTLDNIEVGVDGKEWVVISRKKTHVRSAIPILPRAKDILIKYNYKLPVYCNQRTNSYLKEIADLCNINKTLTSHIARHTFATTVTLSRGIPIETVSKMLGHTDIRTTQIYAKVIDRKVAQDMQSLM